MNKKQSPGFTLIEIIIVIVLTTIVSGFIGAMLTAGLNSYFRAEALTSLSNKGSLAMERMFKELKNAVSFSNMGAMDVTFARSDGVVIRYFFSGSALNRVENAGVSVPLSDEVAGLNFSYYGANLAVTATPALVRAMSIQLTQIENGHQFPLINAVYLKNMQ